MPIHFGVTLGFLLEVLLAPAAYSVERILVPSQIGTKVAVTSKVAKDAKNVNESILNDYLDLQATRVCRKYNCVDEESPCRRVLSYVTDQRSDGIYFRLIQCSSDENPVLKAHIEQRLARCRTVDADKDMSQLVTSLFRDVSDLDKHANPSLSEVTSMKNELIDRILPLFHFEIEEMWVREAIANEIKFQRNPSQRKEQNRLIRKRLTRLFATVEASYENATLKELHELYDFKQASLAKKLLPPKEKEDKNIALPGAGLSRENLTEKLWEYVKPVLINDESLKIFMDHQHDGIISMTEAEKVEAKHKLKPQRVLRTPDVIFSDTKKLKETIKAAWFQEQSKKAFRDLQLDLQDKMNPGLHFKVKRKDSPAPAAHP